MGSLEPIDLLSNSGKPAVFSVLMFFNSLETWVGQVKKSQKEKQFLQSCRLSTLDKQVTIKASTSS